jgi:hypothetical protein
VRPHTPTEEIDVSMPPIKKIVLWLLVIFMLYAILTSPKDSASIVGTAWDVIANGVRNIGRFFDALINKG